MEKKIGSGKVITWKIKKVRLPLKFKWKISRGEISFKDHISIAVSDGEFQGLGEASPNKRYDESWEIVESSFQEFCKNWDPAFSDSDELRKTFEKIVSEIDNFPSCLRFAMESALIRYEADSFNQSVEEVLGVEKVSRVKSCFSLPIMPISEVSDFIEKHNLKRFHSLKIKIGTDSPGETIQEVARNFSGNLRIDANEAFSNPASVMSFVEKIKDLPVEILEQPFPSSELELFAELKKVSPFPLFADESLTNQEVVSEFSRYFDGVNVKLMKSGGYLKAKSQLQKAKELGLKTMIGCMIETSLGISSAMHLASLADYFDLDGFLIIDKDPYNLVVEESGEVLVNELQ